MVVWMLHHWARGSSSCELYANMFFLLLLEAGVTNGSSIPINLPVNVVQKANILLEIGSTNICTNHILFGAESSWQPPIRALLYCFGLLYCFVGLATITNLYMQVQRGHNLLMLFISLVLAIVNRNSCLSYKVDMLNLVNYLNQILSQFLHLFLALIYMQAMDKIVQQTRKVVRRDPHAGVEEVVHARIWNPVLADITLLALGTSAPQISLAIIDAIQQLGEKTSAGTTFFIYLFVNLVFFYHYLGI